MIYSGDHGEPNPKVLTFTKQAVEWEREQSPKGPHPAHTDREQPCCLGGLR